MVDIRLSVVNTWRGFVKLSGGKGRAVEPLGISDLLQAAETLVQIAKERERSHR